MENLPDELLLNIFSKLPQHSLLTSVRCACWRWYHLSFDSSLWTEINLSTFNCGQLDDTKAKNSEGIRSMLRKTQENLTKLTFGDVALEDDVYELLGIPVRPLSANVEFWCLRTLDYSYSRVKPRSLRIALTANPTIEELILSYTNVPFHEAMKEAIQLTNLKKLVFISMDMDMDLEFVLSHHFDDDAVQLKHALMMVPKRCPLLEVLELHTMWCHLLDDAIIQQFTKCCPNLRRTSFTWSSRITENAFDNLTEGSHKITELVLSDRQAVGPYLDFVLPNFPLLSVLTVSGHNVHIDDCRAIAAHCPLLEELSFERSGPQSERPMFNNLVTRRDSLCGLELNIISEGCRNLRKIHAPCSDIDDASVIQLSEHCIHLEDINFSQCHRLTSRSVRVLSYNLLCLRKVNFLEVNIKCDALVGLFIKCSKLQEAICDFHGQPLPSSLMIDTSSSLASQTLTDSGTQEEYSSVADTICDEDIPLIDMSSSEDDSEFYDLINDLKRHSTVSLPNSQTDESVVYGTLLSPLPSPVPVKSVHCHLKKLSLKNCPCSADSLQALFKECPDLTHVALDCSLGLTDETVITLVRSCPVLKTLSIPVKPNTESPVYGDLALLEMAKYCSCLEVVSFLFNDRITTVGVTALFIALDTTLRSMQSISLCVGQGYQCSLHTVAAHGFKHLTERSKRMFLNTAMNTERRNLSILHLEYGQSR